MAVASPDAASTQGLASRGSESTGLARWARWIAVLAVVTTCLGALTGVAVARWMSAPGSSTLLVTAAASDPRGNAASAPVAGDVTIALTSLLARRGDAVRHHDLVAFTSTQDRAAHAPAAARVMALRWASWTYTVSTLDVAPGGGAAVGEVILHTTLQGEVSAEEVQEHITARRTSRGWVITSEQAVGPRQPLWMLGRISVVNGRSSQVIGIDTSVSVITRLARMADQAVSAVTTVWGHGWSRHVVVLVPRDQAQAARGLGRRSQDLDGLAAVTTTGGGGTALRVWINTSTLLPLSGVGQAVVLRHEVVHVATRAPLDRSTPLWLEEGFAEYVGYRGSGIPLSVATTDLLRVVRAGSRPAPLPSDSAFHSGDLTVAYESAQLACDEVVSRVGLAGLLRLYRVTAAGVGAPEANVSVALRRVIGLSAQEFAALVVSRRTSLAS